MHSSCKHAFDSTCNKVTDRTLIGMLLQDPNSNLQQGSIGSCSSSRTDDLYGCLTSLQTKAIILGQYSLLST